MSHPRFLDHHISAVRTSSFMYVSMFFISVWHFIIYDPIGNTAQLGMLLPSGRGVMCWFVLMCYLAFQRRQLLPLSRMSAQCCMTKLWAWWCWTRCAIHVWKRWMACRSLPVIFTRKTHSLCATLSGLLSATRLKFPSQVSVHQTGIHLDIHWLQDLGHSCDVTN